MSNKVNLGLKALGGVAVLVALGFVVNFVISQLQGHSVAANNTPDNNMPVNSLETNSQLIAFASTAEDGNAEIYTMHTDGSNQVNITRDPANDTSPVWSSDGKRLAFLSDRSGSPQIYSMNPDGTELIQLTNISDTHYWVYTNWSPDGKYIAFESSRLGTLQVWVMESSGQNAKMVSIQPGSIAFSPQWSRDGLNFIYNRDQAMPVLYIKQFKDLSPEFKVSEEIRPIANASFSADGQWIVFESWKNNNTDIYRMAVNGSNLTQLTMDPAVDYNSAWRP